MDVLRVGAEGQMMGPGNPEQVVGQLPGGLVGESIGTAVHRPGFDLDVGIVSHLDVDLRKGSARETLLRRRDPRERQLVRGPTAAHGPSRAAAVEGRRLGAPVRRELDRSDPPSGRPLGVVMREVDPLIQRRPDGDLGETFPPGMRGDAAPNAPGST